MTSPLCRMALAILAVQACACPGARAHAVCGSRVYPVTLTLDDPGVADEITIPQIQYTRAAADGGPGPGHDVELDFEYDKRLTEEIGFAFNDGYTINQTDNAKTEAGFQDLVLTTKWAKCLSPDHDFELGFGVIREFGHTGTTHIGTDIYGNTAPTVYFGKDLEEIPIPALQPIAFTGELSYAIADKSLKFGPDGQANNGNVNQVIGGLSIQYSIPFLQAQIKDYGLPEPIAHLIPLVELGYVSGINAPNRGPGGSPTQFTIAPGVIYLRSYYQVGIEALIPANRAAGTNVGVIVQYHLFIDDLSPHGIGAPILELLGQ